MLPQSLATIRYAPIVVLLAVKVNVDPTWSVSSISSQNRVPQGEGLTAFHSLPECAAAIGASVAVAHSSLEYAGGTGGSGVGGPVRAACCLSSAITGSA